MSLEETYRLILIMVSIGCLQASLENLIVAIKAPSINNFPLRNTALTSKYLNWLHVCFDSPGVWIISVVRFLAIATMLTLSIADASVWYLPLLVVFLELLTFQRYYYLPVSETPLQRSVLIATGFHYLLQDEQVSFLGIVFISIQILLAYFAAGWHKLHSGRWRNGKAMFKFFWKFTGRKYNEQLLKFMPLFTAAGWSVIIIELLFPISLLGGQVTTTLLITGFLFHASLSLGLGINSFFWTFVGCYPALLYLSNRIHDYLF